MKQRKIIQIATTSIPGLDGVHPPGLDIVALCDDGTVWLYSLPDGAQHWFPIPDVPQEDAARCT